MRLFGQKMNVLLACPVLLVAWQGLCVSPLLVESTAKDAFYNYIEVDHDLDAARFARPRRLGYGHYQWALVSPHRDTLSVDVRLDMRTLGFGTDHISSRTSNSTATLEQFQAWFPSQRKQRIPQPDSQSAATGKI